ncbi:rod shape-determining protein MreC [Portibacter lacus]|uniref:Cell shape-determining protein MreC n=1 Tax=Portibacter lacus TaxID=1099794 RepID=A0AA37SPT3_9BACT|nr:rod shape-determining protein MreC [Portibacter lacus]GLR16596.1 cell shape-determining protein MreC [Portibacter lacus]
MQNLLLLFARVGNLILFIVLEILCIYLIVNYNQEQKGIYINSSNIMSASMLKRYNSFTEYLKLGDKNDRLAEENSKLLEELINLKSVIQLPEEKVDSIRRFRLMPAAVINNSINQKNNKITINKGADQGIKKGQGVINNEGIVGIISDVSSNYATAISLLNLQTNISVKLKRTKEIGELQWDGRSVKRLTMNAVPPHVEVLQGDSVITSGYSTIFPGDLFVGVVEDVKQDKRNGFLSLEVLLNNDISRLDYVYVIENLKAMEQLELEADE